MYAQDNNEYKQEDTGGRDKEVGTWRYKDTQGCTRMLMHEHYS